MVSYFTQYSNKQTNKQKQKQSANFNLPAAQESVPVGFEQETLSQVVFHRICLVLFVLVRRVGKTNYNEGFVKIRRSNKKKEILQK